MPHLKTRNSESAGIIRGGGGGYYKGTVWNVLVIELHRNLIITCQERGTQEGKKNLSGTNSDSKGYKLLKMN